MKNCSIFVSERLFDGGAAMKSCSAVIAAATAPVSGYEAVAPSPGIVAVASGLNSNM
jgi:hypothetical protein